MGTWHTRGLRGSTLEDMVNRTNERYLEQELALIQKIPTSSDYIGVFRTAQYGGLHRCRTGNSSLL